MGLLSSIELTLASLKEIAQEQQQDQQWLLSLSLLEALQLLVDLSEGLLVLEVLLVLLDRALRVDHGQEELVAPFLELKECQ